MIPKRESRLAEPSLSISANRKLAERRLAQGLPASTERGHSEVADLSDPKGEIVKSRRDRATLSTLLFHALQQKQAGLPATVKTSPPPRAVPDLMEAFRKSLAAVESEAANDERKPSNASRPKKSKAKVEGQTEMLLPIAGGKAEAEVKPAKVSTPRRRAG